MPPQQVRGRARSLIEAHGARVAPETHGNHDEGDDDNHQESVMGGRASALGGNIGKV